MSSTNSTLKLSSLAALAVIAAVAAPSAAHATVIWRGDYETGNLAQWSKAQSVSPERLQISTSPVTQGHYALRTELRHGDFVSYGSRAEVVLGSQQLGEGQERWYSWSTMFDQNYPIDPGWQVFTQWHHSGSGGSPPLEFTAAGNIIKLESGGQYILWTAPLVRGVWHKFVFHVMFSASSSRGFVEIFYDGKRVLSKKPWATLYPGQTAYLKQGLYRKATIVPTGIIHHDGFIEATTMAEAAPELLLSTHAAKLGLGMIGSGDTGVASEPDQPVQEISAADRAELDARMDSPAPSDGNPEGFAGVSTTEGLSPEAVQQAAVASMGCSTGGSNSVAWTAVAALAMCLTRMRLRRAVREGARR